MKLNKTLSKVLICGCPMAIIAPPTILAITSCSTTDNEIVDQEYNLEQLKTWDYDGKTSKHEKEDFSDKEKNDSDILNYFTKHFHKNDLLNLVVNYYDLLTENDIVKDSSGAEVPLMNCLSDDTKLHVEYIRELESGHFHFSVSLLCYLKEEIQIQISYHTVKYWIPVPKDAVVELQIYNNDDYKVGVGEAYYRSVSDLSEQEYAGNNLQIAAVDSKDSKNVIFIETKVGEEGYQDYLAYVSLKNSWADLPIKGFDDVKLPQID